MVFIISSVLIGMTLRLAGAAPAVQYYASKYDHIDVEAILNNRRMVNYYSACLLNKGPCPPEGVDLKRILPEALQTNCGRCTEKQATVALRAIKRLRKEYPKIWSQLTQQWDPNDVFVRKFETSFGNNNGKPRPVEEASPTSTNSISNLIPDSKRPESTTTTRIPSTSATTFDNKNGNPRPIEEASSTSTNSISNLIPDSRRPESTPTTKKTINRIPSTSTTSPRPLIASTSSSPSLTSSRPPSTSLRPSSTSLRPIPNFLPINTFFTNPPIPIRPIVNLNLGANLGATVSGLVRGLGVIGSRVMETGAEIAEVVIKNLSRPLSL